MTISAVLLIIPFTRGFHYKIILSISRIEPKQVAQKDPL